MKNHQPLKIIQIITENKDLKFFQVILDYNLLYPNNLITLSLNHLKFILMLIEIKEVNLNYQNFRWKKVLKKIQTNHLEANHLKHQNKRYSKIKILVIKIPYLKLKFMIYLKFQKIIQMVTLIHTN